MSWGFVTSAAKPEAPLPKSFAVASASWRLRETTRTLAPPAWAKTRAMPLPMPLLAPVTMTDLPLSESVISCSSVYKETEGRQSLAALPRFRRRSHTGLFPEAFIHHTAELIVDLGLGRLQVQGA